MNETEEELGDEDEVRHWPRSRPPEAVPNGCAEAKGVFLHGYLNLALIDIPTIVAAMLNAVLVFNNAGQPRLTKFYTQLVCHPQILLLLVLLLLLLN